MRMKEVIYYVMSGGRRLVVSSGETPRRRRESFTRHGISYWFGPVKATCWAWVLNAVDSSSASLLLYSIDTIPLYEAMAGSGGQLEK